MAPREPPTPRGPAHSHQRRNAVDEDILARTGRAVRADQAREQRGDQTERSCFYCLEGWVFLGPIGHDGDEVIEAIRCRCCNGTGQIANY